MHCRQMYHLVHDELIVWSATVSFDGYIHSQTRHHVLAQDWNVLKLSNKKSNELIVEFQISENNRQFDICFW